ncbi:MAG: hypothetical protein JO101_05095 [Candidatus Eremiobacteraeota bacterium]|nr:hypothetical protein [Candidatus Eremiobacteraeota bacterium]MBV8354677.1 hypothetical protein [Candidatus Eremiobacteraeota bacterium]
MNNPAAWANALIVASFPLLCIVSIGAAWLMHSRARIQLAAACPPLIPVAYVVAAAVIGIIGALLRGQTPGLHSKIIKP